MERNPNNNDLQDKQLQRLAGQLRDTGTAPDRDLWPDINAAIDSAEAGKRPTGRRVADPWRLAAVAAAVILMLAAGWVGIGSINGTAPTTDVAENQGSREGGLAVLDRALEELNLALADDPDNRSLTQLVLMVHKSRGSLLRKNSDNLLRD
jgi:hypothetical protein